MNSTRELLFEDLAKAVEWWASSTAELLVSPDADHTGVTHVDCFRRVARALHDAGASQDDVRTALFESMQGLATSFLTILDGGTKLAETTRVRLVDDLTGEQLGQDLHEDFVGYLMDSGRLRVDDYR